MGYRHRLPHYYYYSPALRLSYSCVTAAGIDFRIVYDSTLQVMAPNALVALSQNDERARDPQILARYLLRVIIIMFEVLYCCFTAA